jgi:hypothetical protein
MTGHWMKPIESNVSPYLQQPLRSMDEVRQERERRQREELGAITVGGLPSQSPPTPANDPGTAPSAGAAAAKTLVDQTA